MDPGSWIERTMEQFGRYRIQGELGRGASGAVYDAVDTGLGRRVALKILEETDEEGRRRFEREARLAAGLEHEQIVRVHDAGEIDGRLYLTMAPLDGGDIAAWVRRRGPPPREVALLLAGVARAVHFAHTRGVIHRDLKPGNLLMDAQDRPVVTDFGIARLLDATHRLTTSGQLLGTPVYMAPEQFRGQAVSADARADVWSLGVVLYELLTGEVPFDADSFAALSMKVLNEDPVPPSRRRSTVSPQLDEICLMALARDSSQRYPSAESLAEDLERFAEGRAVEARGGVRRQRLRRLWRRLRLAAALAAVAAVGAAAWWIGRDAGLGALVVFTDPPGARVTVRAVDGRAVEPSRLAEGRYLVTAELEGRKALTVNVWIGRGERESLSLPLVETVPEGMVYVAGGAIEPFFIDRYEVTVGEFEKFLEWGYRLDAVAVEAQDWSMKDRPMAHVTLADARAYAAWCGKRLPTEQEWAWAALGVDRRAYPWGDRVEPRYAVCNRAYPLSRQKTPDEDLSVYGCRDMAGNVREWTEEGAVKGGGWNAALEDLRLSRRPGPERRDPAVGFRCAK